MLVSLRPNLLGEVVHLHALRPAFEVLLVVSYLPELKAGLLENKSGEYQLVGASCGYGCRIDARVQLKDGLFEQSFECRLSEQSRNASGLDIFQHVINQLRRFWFGQSRCAALFGLIL